MTLLITEAHLPHTFKARARTRRVVYHTTGRNLARLIANKGFTPGTRDFDDAVIQWYRTSNFAFFGCYLVGTSGACYELATPRAWTQHAASLPKDTQKQTPPQWWLERWPEYRHPTELLDNSRFINATSIGVDLVPMPDADLPHLHSQATMEAAAELGRHLAATYGLTLEPRHHLGHEDVDPWRRGKESPWDPGWVRADFMNLLDPPGKVLG